MLHLRVRMQGGDGVVEDRHWRGGEKREADGRDEVEVMNKAVGLMCADSSYCVSMRVPTSLLTRLILSVFVLHKQSQCHSLWSELVVRIVVMMMDEASVLFCHLSK